MKDTDKIPALETPCPCRAFIPVRSPALTTARMEIDHGKAQRMRGRGVSFHVGLSSEEIIEERAEASEGVRPADIRGQVLQTKEQRPKLDMLVHVC